MKNKLKKLGIWLQEVINQKTINPTIPPPPPPPKDEIDNG